jgi:hypothetical protein
LSARLCASFGKHGYEELDPLDILRDSSEGPRT